MELLLLASVFIAALLLSMHVALAMVLATTVVLLVADVVPLQLIAQKAVRQVSLFPLLAIPAFIFAGELMNASGLTESLSNFARFLVGRWRSGLGMATVLACMFFGGLTGSGLADTVAIATLMIPVLVRHGYPPPFAAAIVASSGSLGPIIPPSIPMVIYASIVPSVSIAALFVGGIVPGLLIGIGLLAVVAIIGRRVERGDASEEDIRESALMVTLKVLPASVVPILILFGIVGGIVTVTEAAVLAVAYALAYGFVSRRLDLGAIVGCAERTVSTTGLVGIIIAMAGPFSFLMAFYRAPERVGELMLALAGGSPELLMVILCVVLIGLGLLVEATSLVIILAPILAGMATIAGINQLHMALVGISALMIGLFTPPVGTNLYAVIGVSGQSMESISRYLLPFILVSFLVILVMALSPSLVTFLPRLLLD